MITPPEPEALILLRDALKYPAHLERLLPALRHSTSWSVMLRSVERAHVALLEDYELHKEKVNAQHERAKRDEE